VIFFLKNKIQLINDIYFRNEKINFIQNYPTFLYHPPPGNKKLNKKLRNKWFIFLTWPYFNPTSTMSLRRDLIKVILKDISFSKNKYEKIFLMQEQ
jgi:hypothetical protein|tara:strand:+ start:72 stop:359 length:288 start_codon:yes stop_codon:yes gene_type:complete